jgi:hypothetical protein
LTHINLIEFFRPCPSGAPIKGDRSYEPGVHRPRFFSRETKTAHEERGDSDTTKAEDTDFHGKH